jgi:hypothetical protein
MQTKNSQQAPWALTTLGARTLMCVMLTLSCGDKRPTAAANAEPATADGASQPNGDLKQHCLDVVFAESPQESAGIVACPSKEGEVYRLDLFSTRAVACEGRGMDHLTSTDLCDSDAACPAGSTCTLDGLCYEPAECEDDSQCGAQGACACAGMFPVGSAYGTAIRFNQCLPAECRSDSDCNGYSCGLSDSSEPCTGKLAGFFCHSSQDECTSSSDCGTTGACLYEASSRRWSCRPVHEVFCD